MKKLIATLLAATTMGCQTVEKRADVKGIKVSPVVYASSNYNGCKKAKSKDALARVLERLNSCVLAKDIIALKENIEVLSERSNDFGLVAYYNSWVSEFEGKVEMALIQIDIAMGYSTSITNKLRKAYVLEKNQQYDEALSIYRSVYKTNPKLVFEDLTRVNFYLGNFKEVISVYNQLPPEEKRKIAIMSYRASAFLSQHQGVIAIADGLTDSNVLSVNDLQLLFKSVDHSGTPEVLAKFISFVKRKYNTKDPQMMWFIKYTKSKEKAAAELAQNTGGN